MIVFIVASKLRFNFHQYKLAVGLQFQDFDQRRLDANTQQTYALDDE